MAGTFCSCAGSDSAPTDSGAGITESGDGWRADLKVRGAGTALIKDSADELLCLAFDFSVIAESFDDVDGRLVGFASISRSGIDALPSNTPKESSLSNGRLLRVLSAGKVSGSVVDAGVASAEGARSRARGLEGPRGREFCGFVTILGASVIL